MRGRICAVNMRSRARPKLTAPLGEIREHRMDRTALSAGRHGQDVP